MSARLISLASGVLPDFGPVETAQAAIAAGWPAVGIWVEPTTWTDAIAAEVRTRVTDVGITVLDVEVVWLKPGDDDPDHFRIIDAGAAIGARNVLAVSSDPDDGATAAKLARLQAHAAERGMRVSLEFAAFTEVKNIAQATAILEQAGGAGLLIDPLHLARTGGTPDDVAAVDPRHFAYAQFCDAPAHGPSVDDVPAIVHEALDLRLDVGKGDLPLAALSKAMPADLPLSIELRSKALRDGFPDAIERAYALLEATRAGLELIGQ